MWDLRLSRRHFLALSGAAAAAQWLTRAPARAPSGTDLRIGVVLPTKTGSTAVGSYGEEMAGESALMGATMAEEELGADAAATGTDLKVLLATAPDGVTAARAAARLAAAGDVAAFIGGLGAGQAAALSQVAEMRRIPFLNIGAVADVRPGEGCTPYTFDVEASAAMYLDGLVTWFARSGHERWYFVQADSAEQEAHYWQAGRTLTGRSDLGAIEVGRTVVPVAQPVFLDVFDDIRRAEPDVVLLLLEAPSQLVFLGQYETSSTPAAVTGFPAAATQTREFYAATHASAPTAGSGYRVTLWDATLVSHGAGELNDRFMTRWGTPMDAPAWAAYAAVKIVHDAVAATRTLEGTVLIDYLESPQAVFDVYKGSGVSFRASDHQLRQPLYMVELSSEAVWGRSPFDRLEVAKVVAELPEPASGPTDTAARLDEPRPCARTTTQR